MLEKIVSVIAVTHISCNQHHLVTDQTPFYIKGGGQQSDTGFFISGNDRYEISSATYAEDGRVIHSFTADRTPGIKPGDKIRLVVDEVSRKMNSAIHTAGELICAAVKTLGHNWPVASAIHYTDNASVEFDVQLTDTEKEQLTKQLQQQLDEMLLAGSLVKIYRFTEKESVIQHCGYFPEYVSSHEPIRVVKVWKTAYGRPCAGTHLDNINQLEKVEITKIKNKKGLTQVRYQTTAR